MTEPVREALKGCPWCGAGETVFQENGRVWLGMKYSDPVSVSVRHWCEPVEGQPSRMIERVGKTREDAIAAWNRRSSLGEPPLDRLRVLAHEAIANAMARERSQGWVNADDILAIVGQSGEPPAARVEAPFGPGDPTFDNVVARMASKLKVEMQSAIHGATAPETLRAAAERVVVEFAYLFDKSEVDAPSDAAAYFGLVRALSSPALEEKGT